MYHDNDQMVTDVSVLYVLKMTKCKNVFRNFLGFHLVLKQTLSLLRQRDEKIDMTLKKFTLLNI